jgi:DNA-binding transcriptional MerR regulator
LAEYRLEALAARSGVSVRNIRAYRERGLLDAPRREGRSAVYGDRHLSQLATISELLRKGFTTAHIAEFFAAARQGHDIADMLGLQRAMFSRRKPADPVTLDVDPDGDEGRRLVAHGLAEMVDGRLSLIDPRMAQLVGQVTDQSAYVRMILGVADGTAEALDVVTTAIVDVWERRVAERFGPNYVHRPEDVAELQRMVADFRVLGSRVVADKLADALGRRLATAVADDTTDLAAGAASAANGPSMRVVAGSPPNRWASHTGMIATTVSAAATTLITGAWLGRNRFPKIQIGSVCTAGPAVKVVTTISSKLSANARIAPATNAPRIIGNVTYRKVCHDVAPRSAEASSRLVPSRRNRA